MWSVFVPKTSVNQNQTAAIQILQFGKNGFCSKLVLERDAALMCAVVKTCWAWLQAALLCG